MDVPEIVDRLRGLPLIGSLPEAAKARAADVFLRVSAPVTYTDGEPIIKARALGGHDGYVLLEGEVLVEKEGTAPVVVGAPALLGEMLQFNPRAQRTANVRARGPVTALKFSWQEFYAQAKQGLSEDEQGHLLEAIERSVWERFGSETILDLALFDGLPDRLKVRVGLTMQWLVQRQALADGERLFAQGDLCGATGYVIVHGAVRLVTTNFPPRVVEAPDIVGVMPAFEPGAQWSATATAQSDVDLLRFSWQEYMAMLERRLSQDELDRFVRAVGANAPRHFVC